MAALRTLGSFETDSSVKCDEPLAREFAPSFAGTSKNFKKFGIARLYPGLYETILANSKIWDSLFEAQIKQNHFKGDPAKRIQQVVVLGADCGTRLIRFKKVLEDKKVKAFEVDFFGYQKTKLATLKKLNIKSNIAYLEADVAKAGDIASALAKTSFEAKKPTLWLVEGVLPFISAALATQLLKTIKDLSGPNCVVLMDYVPQLASHPAHEDDDLTWNKAAQGALRNMFPDRLGSFELEAEKAEAWMHQHGFYLNFEAGPEFQQPYLLKQDGSFVGKVPDCLRILLAISRD